MGSNREKSNIAIAILDKWRIWTYPISPFKKIKYILLYIVLNINMSSKDALIRLWMIIQGVPIKSGIFFM